MNRDFRINICHIPNIGDCSGDVLSVQAIEDQNIQCPVEVGCD